MDPNKQLLAILLQIYCLDKIRAWTNKQEYNYLYQDECSHSHHQIQVKYKAAHVVLDWSILVSLSSVTCSVRPNSSLRKLYLPRGQQHKPQCRIQDKMKENKRLLNQGRKRKKLNIAMMTIMICRCPLYTVESNYNQWQFFEVSLVSKQVCLFSSMVLLKHRGIWKEVWYCQTTFQVPRPVGLEDLDAVVFSVTNNNVSRGRDGNPFQSFEFARPRSPATKLSQESSLRREDLDPVVARVPDKDVALVVHCHAPETPKTQSAVDSLMQKATYTS